MGEHHLPRAPTHPAPEGPLIAQATGDGGMAITSHHFRLRL
jgi:hypothetical protein